MISTEKENDNKYLYLFFLCAAIVLGFGMYTYAEPLMGMFFPQNVAQLQILAEKKHLNQNIGDSLLRDRPADLQNYFKKKVADRQNDQLSKAAIYFITHRFFDNGGDIYEIVDYVHSDSALAFLDDAQAVYPEIFAKVTARKTLTKQEQLLAYLSYLEVLQKDGYADVASSATAAAKYIELYDTEKSNKKTTFSSDELDRFKATSIEFALAAKPAVDDFMARTGVLEGTYSKDDMLAGLSQYGVTLAYFKKHAVPFDSQYTYMSVFDAALQYASLHKLVLEPFTALNYNYALIVADDQSISTVEQAQLGPILDKTYKLITYKKNGLVDRMLHGESLGYNANGIYGSATIESIITYDPEFKKFMVARGYHLP